MERGPRRESQRARRAGPACCACRRGRGLPRGRRGIRRPDSRPPSRPDPRRGPGTGGPWPAGGEGRERVPRTSAVSGSGRFLFRMVVLINDLRTPRDRVLSLDSDTTSPGSSCLANRIATVRRCFAKLKVFMLTRHCRGGCRKMAAVVREHGLGQAEKRAAARVNSVPSHKCFRIRCIVFLPSKKDCQNALWTSSGVAGGNGSPVMEVRGAETQFVDHWRGTLKRMGGLSGRAPVGRLTVPDGPETVRSRTARRTHRTKAMTCWKPKVTGRRETGNQPRMAPRRALAPPRRQESRKRLCRWTTAGIQ